MLGSLMRGGGATPLHVQIACHGKELDTSLHARTSHINSWITAHILSHHTKLALMKNRAWGAEHCWITWTFKSGKSGMGGYWNQSLWQKREENEWTLPAGNWRASCSRAEK